MAAVVKQAAENGSCGATRAGLNDVTRCWRPFGNAWQLFAKCQKPRRFSHALHTTPKKAHRIFSAKGGNFAHPFPFGGKQYGPKTELT